MLMDMPTPERTSLDAIVTAARDLLEHDGLAGLTMQSVALRVGVRAPSLYKRVSSRDHLIQLVAEATLSDLAGRMESATTAAEVVDVFRTFGHERPAAFQLVMTPGAGVSAARPEFGAAASVAVVRFGGELAGEEHALEAARTLTAWVVGFVGMELNGRFELGGDVEAAWAFGRERIVAALGMGR